MALSLLMNDGGYLSNVLAGTWTKVIQHVLFNSENAIGSGGSRSSDPRQCLDLIQRSTETVITIVGKQNDIRICLGQDLGRFHPLHAPVFDRHLAARKFYHMADTTTITASAIADDKINI